MRGVRYFISIDERYFIPDTAFEIHSKPSITPLRLSSDEDDDGDDDRDHNIMIGIII